MTLTNIIRIITCYGLLIFIVSCNQVGKAVKDLVKAMREIRKPRAPKLLLLIGSIECFPGNEIVKTGQRRDIERSIIF